MEEVKIFVINHQNPERKERMQKRADLLGIQMRFLPGCGPADPRLVRDGKTLALATVAHMECIEEFLKGDGKFCIVCEDDIYIKKTFKQDMVRVLRDFQEMGLDILLLGYLLHFRLPLGGWGFVPKTGWTYFDYHSEHWGAQMYLISRAYAEKLVREYKSDPSRFVTNPDWNITKIGNRAMVYPMFAVEEGENLSNDLGQKHFHKLCYETNYVEGEFY